MFDSIYSIPVSATEFFIMAGVSIVAGLVFSWIMSFRVRSSKRFFAVVSIMPFIVAAVITFVNGNIGAGVAVGGAFALIRFRSAQGSADELAALLIAMGSGIDFGMGYVGYGVLILLGLGAIYYLVSNLPIFEHPAQAEDKLLQITIPEALNYTDVFDDTFANYLKMWESVGVKTIAMGSLFRVSFKVRLKDPAKEKLLIDELRTKNGKLEISLVPFVEKEAQL